MSDIVNTANGGRASLWAFMRILIAASVLLPITVVYGETLINGCLPIFRAVFDGVSGDFQLLNLAVDNEGVDRVLRATVTWKQITVINGVTLAPDPRGTANASTLLAHALQGPLVALLAVCGWPLRNGPGTWAEGLCRFAVLAPLVLIVLIVDVPVVLVGELWALVLDTLDPERVSALVIWKSFMQGGGRYALALAAAAISVQTGSWLACRLIQPRNDKPLRCAQQELD